jgi:hypothetical protein
MSAARSAVQAAVQCVGSAGLGVSHGCSRSLGVSQVARSKQAAQQRSAHPSAVQHEHACQCCFGGAAGLMAGGLPQGGGGGHCCPAARAAASPARCGTPSPTSSTVPSKVTMSPSGGTGVSRICMQARCATLVGAAQGRPAGSATMVVLGTLPRHHAAALAAQGSITAGVCAVCQLQGRKLHPNRGLLGGSSCGECLFDQPWRAWRAGGQPPTRWHSISPLSRRLSWKMGEHSASAHRAMGGEMAVQFTCSGGQVSERAGLRACCAVGEHLGGAGPWVLGAPPPRAARHPCTRCSQAA